MDTIIVYPTTTQQLNLIQTFMEDMKIRFSIKKEKVKDDSFFTKEAYFAMLDERIKNAEQGNYTTIRGKQELQQFLEQL